MISCIYGWLLLACTACAQEADNLDAVQISVQGSALDHKSFSNQASASLGEATATSPPKLPDQDGDHKHAQARQKGKTQKKTKAAHRRHEEEAGHYVLGSQGAACDHGVKITTKKECELALDALGIPKLGLSDNFPCYKDQAGNGYADGENAGGAHFVCNNKAISVQQACPMTCERCNAGGVSDGGVELVKGGCEAWCSVGNFCGIAAIYQDGGTDCSGCKTTVEAKGAPPIATQPVAPTAAETKSDSSISLFIAVTSGQELAHAQRRAAVRNTWAKLLDFKPTAKMRFIVTGKVQLPNDAETETDVVVLQGVPSGYEFLTHKTAGILDWVLKNEPDAQFIAKVDDDAYFNVLKVWPLLSSTNPPAFLGHISPHDEVHRHGKFAVPVEDLPREFYPPWAHGPAYVMSRDTVKKLNAESQKDAKWLWLEDAQMGMWAERANVKLTHSDEFHCCMDEDKCEPSKADRGVSMHYTRPDCMQSYYARSLTQLGPEARKAQVLQELHFDMALEEQYRQKVSTERIGRMPCSARDGPHETQEAKAEDKIGNKKEVIPRVETTKTMLSAAARSRRSKVSHVKKKRVK